MEFKPSIYQQQIFDWVEKGSGNAVINAVAGSGKTTTIVNALNLIPSNKKVIFVAFNKSIVEELKTRVPSHVDVKTMHSHGFGLIRLHMGNVRVNTDKTYQAIKTLYPSWNVPEELSEGYISRVKQLVELGKINMVNQLDEMDDVVYHYGIDVQNGEAQRAMEIINLTKRNTKEIDMTDMIYYPAEYNLSGKKYDWVLVDECQDLNRCQQEMLKSMLKSNGRFIAVGDPRQAIYGFAGADAESFNRLTQIPNTIVLPLSVNYRCGKKIIDMAQKITPEIEACETAIEGEILNEVKWKTVEDGDFIICRNVKPLVSLCMKLLAQGKKANIKGRDIGLNLINMVKKSKKVYMTDVIKYLITERNLTVERAVAKGKDRELIMNGFAYQSTTDKIEALEVIGGNLKTADAVINKINRIFSEDSDGIILSTVHKAKGLEAERVLILQPELMPSRWAKRPWEREQENNLIYVAYTRAKSTLGFITDFGE